MPALNYAIMLDNSRKGQWSVADFDWSEPMGDIAPDVEAALVDFMNNAAGIETRAVEAFRALETIHADSPDKRDCYALAAEDEIRHRECQLKFVERYGGRESTPSIWTELMLNTVMKAIARAVKLKDPAFVYFALTFAETILDQTLPEEVDHIDDPLAKKVFKRVFDDEHRHLALDFDGLSECAREQGVWAGLRPVVPYLPVLAVLFVPYFIHSVRLRKNIGVPRNSFLLLVRTLETKTRRYPEIRKTLIFRALSLLFPLARRRADPVTA